MPTRSTYLQAFVNSFPIQQILSARCSYGYDMQVPEAVIYVPRAPVQSTTTWQASTVYAVLYAVKPPTRNGHIYQASIAGTSGGSQPIWPLTVGGTVVDGSVTWQEVGLDIVYNDTVIITMGAGGPPPGGNIQRFIGVFRKFDFTLYPRMVGLTCYGFLILAQQYENSNPGALHLGLDLADLTGVGGTDQAVVQAVLSRAGVSYTPSNIGGTGVSWGLSGTPPGSIMAQGPYLWRAGVTETIKSFVGGKGETAIEYINRWDAVSAVYNATGPSGFYRTYETLNGTVVRALIGSRPRGVTDYTFTEGLDISQGTSDRDYPIANRVLVQGFNDPLNSGAPVSNLLSTTIQGSNPFMLPTEQHTYTLSSTMIERGLDADPGTGMSCETVANALMLDVNRETVHCNFETPRDDAIGPGNTVLVQSGTHLPDRLGIGEPLWVVHIDITVDQNGTFRQRMQCLGGGLGPDNYTPAPPI